MCEQGFHPKVFIIYSFIYIHFTGKTEKLLRFLNIIIRRKKKKKIIRFRMKFILDHVNSYFRLLPNVSEGPYFLIYINVQIITATRLSVTNHH